MSTAKLRALVSVVLALTVAAALVAGAAGWELVAFGTPTQMPRLAGDFSATSAAWVQVAFGKAQLSVPDSWWVLYNSPPCLTGSPPGEVFVNPPPGVFHCPAETAPGPATAVKFGPPTSPHSTVLGHPEVINGVFVYPYPTRPQSSYLVPSLEVEITVYGPLAQRVLHTLTWSPRSIVLASGSAPVVPPSWQSVSFAGLRISVPAGWPVTRTQVTPGLGAICRQQGVAFAGTTVTLSTDRHLLVVFCPRMSPTPQQPENGVQVDSGLRTEPTLKLSFPAHCLDLHGLSACPATSPAYSILVLRVRVPGRSKPVYVSIGLAGNAMVGRTILYSLRSAPGLFCAVMASDRRSLATAKVQRFPH
jgi:hypothetical protein